MKVNTPERTVPKYRVTVVINELITPTNGCSDDECTYHIEFNASTREVVRYELKRIGSLFESYDLNR